MQPYLKTNEINISKKKLLFKARTRMLNVNDNFGEKILCPLCEIDLDNQKHLISCIILKMENSEIFRNEDECKYDDIFSSDTKKMKFIASLLENAMKTREKILNK